VGKQAPKVLHGIEAGDLVQHFLPGLGAIVLQIPQSPAVVEWMLRLFGPFGFFGLLGLGILGFGLLGLGLLELGLLGLVLLGFECQRYFPSRL